MQDYFLWNGVDCRQYGIHVTEQPPVTIPLERSTQTNVPGRPGSLTQLEGEDIYDDMILTATCFISDPAQIPAIAAWLKGSGWWRDCCCGAGIWGCCISSACSKNKAIKTSLSFL